MKIRQATTDDVDEIVKTYSIARQYMFESGNRTQWGNGYPSLSLIVSDIESGFSFVVTSDDDEVLGVFYFGIGNAPEYANIEGKWLSSEFEPYGVVHRIASNGKAKGIAKFCFDWCLSKIKSLRIDTHENNETMLALLKSYGFTECGTVYVADGTKRKAFEILKH